MNKTRAFRLASAALFVLLCVVGLVLALLRLGSYVFVFPDSPFWSAIPSLTIMALVLLPWRPPAAQRWIGAGLMGLWLCSYGFHNWAQLMTGYADGNWTVITDAMEAVVMVGLSLARVFATRHRK
ncbi:hypothetical protein ACQ859_30130 [Roseateles chitinivorans]|uniref:hypothetical protein n=1 Tax=Roseateles chitinivorans TaxID=2917965 RepID=UPI003D6793AB